MTSEDFRRIALSMPEAAEGAHMAHPDFRVKGKIFATLMPGDENCGMVKLTPEQQRRFIKEHPEVFEPVEGGWGRKGATQIRLNVVNKGSLPSVRSAVLTAWLNTAPRPLVEAFDASRAG